MFWFFLRLRGCAARNDGHFQPFWTAVRRLSACATSSGNSTKQAKSAILQKEAFFACGQG
jgi:hypothetical protein